VPIPAPKGKYKLKRDMEKVNHHPHHQVTFYKKKEAANELRNFNVLVSNCCMLNCMC